MYSRVYGLPGAGLQGAVRTMEAMQASTLDIEGPVYVADFGGDGPVMLLVHGLGGAHLNWMAAVSYTHLDVYKRQVDSCR